MVEQEVQCRVRGMVDVDAASCEDVLREHRVRHECDRTELLEVADEYDAFLDFLSESEELRQSEHRGFVDDEVVEVALVDTFAEYEVGDGREYDTRVADEDVGSVFELGA